MPFFYEGHQRLSLWYFSPNHCGVVLVSGIMLLCAMLCLLRWRSVFCSVLRFLGSILCLCLMAALAMTYCRGAYVSFFTVSLAAALTPIAWKASERRNVTAGEDNRTGKKAGRRYFELFLSLLPLIFLIIILLVPSGGSRIGSIADAGDKSIIHRLHLWQGGTVLISQNLLHGVGDGPGRLYSLWLQPTTINEAYHSLISDSLTLAATYGIWAALLYLLILSFFFMLGVNTWKASRKREYLYLGGVFASILFCGVFNCGYMLKALRCIAGVSAVWTAVGCIRDYRLAKRCLRRSLFFSLAFSAASCLIIVIAGFHFQKAVPWLVNGSSKIPLEWDGLGKTGISPARMPPKCRLLMFTDNVAARIRPVALPLCELGVDATILPTEGKISEQDEITSRITEWLGNDASGIPSAIVADSKNVSNAVYVALASLPACFQPKCALFFDIIHGHPFGEMAVERPETKVEQTICKEETTSLAEESYFIKTWLESKRLIVSQGK